MKHNAPIGPEDYAEPRCLLCDEPFGAAPAVKPVPQQRIVEKLDDYMSRRDYEGARRHLLYWLEEAKLGGDRRGELLIRNELVGHYRKTGNKEGAFENGEAALALLKELAFEDTISAGTAYVNYATACNAFGENGRALELFEKARRIYEAAPATRPDLLGGLYNNMGLTLTALGRYGEAHRLYDLAMEQMGKVPGGGLEQAVTCLNRANLVEAELGMEQGENRVFALLDQAEELLGDPAAPRDGYYAFVCEKCAPTFSYYGYFLTAQRLAEQAKEIYERT